ncbi:FadR/GntR family transcriptional regulator [Kineococcus sp. SYSU DK006]|uniref:FadR/GntR family transcriptional regulator n=1 Tax=Kineococcus sp. SYSU DK006 TaxID=3383127 RepID=UPI003D7EAA75
MSIEDSAPTSQRRYLNVAQRLLGDVNAGVYQPGQRLPGDRDLASTLGVSRSTVREALLALELVGAINVRHGDGIYVSPADVVRLDPGRTLLGILPQDLLESRVHLESITTRLVAERIDAEQLQALEVLVRAGEQEAVNAEDFNAKTHEGLGFHAHLAALCGNEVLAGVVAQLVSTERHPLWVLLNLHALRGPGAQRRQFEEHLAIFEALRAGDADAAEQAMRTHLTNIQTQMFPSTLSDRQG